MIKELRDINNRLEYIVRKLCQLNSDIWDREEQMTRLEHERERLENRKADIEEKRNGHV